MKRILTIQKHVLLLSVLALFFSFFSACRSDDSKPFEKHDPNKPVVLSSFSPNEGGVRDQILLDGENFGTRSEEHTSELQSRGHLVCRLLLEKKKEKLL